MRCAKFERLIALSVGGDLSARDAERVEEHLRGCAACRELRAELLDSQAALKSLSEDAADPAVLGAVRRRVLEKIENTRPSWWLAWRWKYGLAVAVTVAVVLSVTLSPQPKVEPPPVPVAVKREPLPAGRGSVLETQTRPVRRAVRRPVRKPAPPREEPLVVKMLTDDPDVVIVWLIDQNGG